MQEQDRSSSIAAEHGALRESAAAIRSALERDRCSCGSSGGCTCLRDRVEDFRRRLLQHFAAEEALWQAVEPGCTDWTTLRWIDRLAREHDAFRRRTAEVRLGLADLRPSLEVRSKLRAILDDLFEHELSETKLFQRSVFEGRTGPL